MPTYFATQGLKCFDRRVLKRRMACRMLLSIVLKQMHFLLKVQGYTREKIKYSEIAFCQMHQV